MWDRGGVQDQAGECCHPCPGVRSQAGILESHCHHLLLGLRDTGDCHSPAGMCLLPLSGILALGTAGAWHRVAPGPGILAPDTTRFWHPGTEYHQNLVSQGIPLQQVTVCWRDGADVDLHQQQDGSRARPGVPEAKLPPEPPPFLLKMPDPFLCSSTPPWAGFAVPNLGSDVVNELEALTEITGSCVLLHLLARASRAIAALSTPACIPLEGC